MPYEICIIDIWGRLLVHIAQFHDREHAEFMMRSVLRQKTASPGVYHHVEVVDGNVRVRPQEAGFRMMLQSDTVVDAAVVDTENPDDLSLIHTILKNFRKTLVKK